MIKTYRAEIFADKWPYETTGGVVLLYKLETDSDFKASRDWYLFKERYSKVASQLIRELKS